MEPEQPYERRYVRVDVAIDVAYTLESDAPKTGFSCDLGGGGIRLSTDEDLPLGTVLVLRFRVPDGIERDIVLRGRIVLSFYNAEDRRFVHGLAFTQIDPRDQERIVAFVAAETRRQAGAGGSQD